MSNEIEKRFNVLNPWFDEMDYDWTILKDLGQKNSFKKHEIVFRQNEDGNDLYLVIKGRVRLFLISPNGEEKALAVIGTNGLIGECILNDDSRYSSSAITASEVELIRISKDVFLEKISNEPRYTSQVLDLITKKYRLLCMQTLQLSYTKSLPRMCATFVHLSIRYGETLASQEIRLTINFTHQEMANLLGITRVTIAKNIKWLEENKYIRKDGRYYIINNLDNLANLANEELMLD
ncbi:Crp/Fnr family transcriptional regulator [Radiobacillus sp. PE A8.2]|uniref:Crp/Fnr family transcriptional regulator n=1 Tax=Radiobacillus sp. PE A8.2 TaxID=3380349 RepID=UPI00388EF0AB